MKNTALTQKHIPLSDNIHGPSSLFPPELLHTSGSGLCNYMFDSLSFQIGGGISRDEIDKMHIKLYLNIKRQSERDFPRGAIRNGILDSTKCQSEERKGNLFLLLCIATTMDGTRLFKEKLSYNDSKWKKWIEFLKLYLSMEEWFHDSNPKDEVHKSRPLIAKVLKRLQWFFPRKDNTNGYCIPKMHGMTKFQNYIIRYGSAMNFYGGTGESAHKSFVKAPGQKTQQRVSEFAVQTTKQYYNMLITNRAFESIENQQSRTSVEVNNYKYDHINNDDDISVELSGKYTITITDDLIEDMRNGNDIHASWHSDPKRHRSNHYKFCLNKDLVRVFLKKITENHGGVFRKGDRIMGYTRVATTTNDGNRFLFYAHPCFQGRSWYDWAYVHFEEIGANGNSVECFYPSKILGFVTFENKTFAVVQCTERPLRWSSLEKNFLYKVVLGTNDDISTVTVPLSSLVHPLCVIPDYGGDAKSYFVVLPRRNWSRYFGDKINIA